VVGAALAVGEFPKDHNCNPDVITKIAVKASGLRLINLSVLIAM
jgi:hypothetical protein